MMSRFFVKESDVGEKHICITDREDIHHIRKVLRLRHGDMIEISDGVRWEYEGVIEEIDEAVVTVLITDKQAFAREPRLRITLFQGMPKNQKMDLIVQKCVELGIDSIYPVFMKRCDIRPPH